MSLGIDRPDEKMSRRITGSGLHMDQDSTKGKPWRNERTGTAMRQGLQREANAKRRRRERELVQSPDEAA